MGLCSRFKNFLKRFFPTPINTFNREIGILHQETGRILEILAQQQKQIDKISIQSLEASKYASESVWAAVFNNKITDSNWLENKSFAPGRWAVGYGFLYVMYRVLDETHPKHILELGLGQTTRMITQYVAANFDTKHYVVEEDANWIDFFCNDFKLTGNTELVRLNYEMISYKDAGEVRIYKGFKEKFAGKKFDFISIDAPWSGDMKQYARIDILDLLPDCLDENFIIMIDDCQRSGEKNTVAEIEKKLRESGIPYKTGKYCEKKDFVLIAAKHMQFLTSM